MITPNNNFDLLENIIPYKIVKLKNDGKFYVMVSSYKNYEMPFGQHILFPINDKLDPSYDGNEIYDLMASETEDSLNEYYLYDELAEEIILLDNPEFEDLSDIKIKDIENIKYFIFKNKELIDDNMFSEDELKALNQTFMKIIINQSDRYNNVSTPIDFLYKSVIDFYANGQYDDATILMNSIFNTPITTSITNAGCNCSSTSSCSSSASGLASINTGTSSVPVDTATCIDKYKAAMYQWLIKMLSDTDFYCNWMSLDLDNNVIDIIFNDALIDKLIDLLTQFLNLGFDLSNLNGNNCSNECNCGHSLNYGNYNNSNNGNNNGIGNGNINCSDILNNVSNGLSAACSNYSIIQNYIKVLNWVKNNEINENKNKIYIYGKQFAEIFPLLNF